MAANKFVTMLHRNTNKITLILVYALLEWTLIALLLLNSLYSYLILKFSDYFGLNRPCLLCSRLDHLLDPPNFNPCYRDLVCESHASEISNLAFCSNHRKLADSRDLCEDCSSQSPRTDPPEFSWKLSLLPWMKQIETGEVNKSSCSCCGVVFERKLHSPYLLIKPALKLLECTQMENLVEDLEFDHEVEEAGLPEKTGSESVEEQESYGGGDKGIQVISDHEEPCNMNELETQEEFSGFISSFDCNQMNVGEVGSVGENERVSIQGDDSKDVSSSPVALTKHLEFYIDQQDCHLIPVKPAAPNQDGYSLREDDQGFSGNGDLILDFDFCDGEAVDLVVEGTFSAMQNGEAMLLDNVVHQVSDDGNGETGADVSIGTKIPEDASCVHFLENGCHESIEFTKEDNSSSFQKTEPVSADDREETDGNTFSETVESRETERMEDMYEQVATLDIQCPSTNAVYVQVRAATADGMIDFDVDEVSGEHNVESEPDVSIGTEIPDHESVDDIRAGEAHPSSQCIQEETSTSSAELLANGDCVCENAEEELVEFKTITAEMCDRAIRPHLMFSSELNEADDEVPGTPTSTDSLHQLHKKLLLLERKETLAEELLDGSVNSELECGDTVSTVENLKSALKSEQKALNALYAELEEERSASAVAASQTMAMINRLQEEKSMMQMEALQYQRMMEEQAEYDQEALQLLNDLMIKREKEKSELEKELDIYRKKVQDYEAKDRLMMLRRKKDGSTRSETSASCSNAEDSDGLSVDLNLEPKADEKFDDDQENNNQNTPADAVLYFEESLSIFEKERLSILEQLKVLEEKLVVLNYDDEEEFEDVRPMGYSHETNGTNGYRDHENSEETVPPHVFMNGHTNGSNGNHYVETKKMSVIKAKSLLPLFDAAHMETDDLTCEEYENGYDSHRSLGSHELPIKRLAIEEEVDHVYDRLQALEADREFLKHCVSSLKKGDKGVYLLQEILQHLRDLRNVEVRVRAVGDGVM